MGRQDKKVHKAFVMISQIGISIMVPIFLCLYLGMKFDEWLDTNFITILGILFGIIVAFRNVFIMMRQFYAKDKEKEDAKLQYFKSLKQTHTQDSNKK